MKTITTSVLGIDVPVTNYPENLQEAITAFGGEQNLLEGSLNYVRFHKTNTEARSEVCDRLEAITGIARETKQVKAPTKTDPNNTREEWAESESDFFKRALAQSGRPVDEVRALILNGGDYKVGDQPAGALSIEFSAQGSARTGGPRKVAQMYTKAAQTVIDGGNADAVANKLEQVNPGLTVARDEAGKPTLEGLAQAIKTNRERVDRETNASLGIAA